MNTTVNPSELERCKSGDVGRRLRALRQGLGWTVADVSDRLRIRKVFLTAIEEGCYDSLPGPTYAVGFIRAYADCLGWDGAEAVRLFRQESSLPSRQSSLDFPDPDAKKVPLSKKPLFFFLGMIVLAYGGWRLAMSVPPDTSLFSLVQKASERMLSLVENRYFLGARSVEKETGKKEAGVSPPSSPPAVKRSGRRLSPRVVGPGEPLAPSPGADPASETSASETATFSVSPVLPDADREPSGSARDPAPRFPQKDGVSLSYPQSVKKSPLSKAPLRERSPLESVSSEADASDTSDKTDKRDPLPPARELDQSFVRDSMRAPSSQGERDLSKSRIVLRAVSDSWVEVSSPKGLVASRLMRKGDSLPLPTQDNLELVTGNAGGLRIELDGTELPAPGKSGEVRRGISLDPETLKDSIKTAG